ncbi:MAG: hypothetical protein U0519_04520 [Candidatus Gracilibacteria bacterium]
MKWLTNEMAVFWPFWWPSVCYEKLEGKIEADYNFFYTSNISLKRTLLDKYPFDPSFSGYGWEDIEQNLPALFARITPFIIKMRSGYHDHMMTESSPGGPDERGILDGHLDFATISGTWQSPSLWKKLAFGFCLLQHNELLAF